MISEGRSGSDNVYTLKDGTFAKEDAHLDSN